ncbi:GNAT family N-acetyltransferase [Clostridiaceae bacterium M8S5]|nr:GNAT family N-acetyltransferase [Clostridiaceae bacterium M8S5]
MKDNIIIVKMNKEDYKDIPQVYASSFNEEPWNVDWYDIPQFNEDSNWVAKYDDRVVGFVITFISDSQPYISVLAVEQKYQRLGTGVKLMKEAILYYQNKNYNEINVHVGPDRVSANYLYKKLGFIKIGIKDEFDKLTLKLNRRNCMNNGEIYWIGGSPCSGKSAIAQMLADKYGFKYYKCDDFLEKYAVKGAEKGKEIMKKILSLDLDGIWLRDVDELVKDEIKFYEEAFEVIIDDLKEIDNVNGIIVEGAAILPINADIHKVSKDRYISIVPTSGFQVNKYSERDWVEDYLKDCSNPKIAFENWMQRDIKFAEIIKQQADELGYKSIVVDGKKSIQENYDIVAEHFGLI